MEISNNRFMITNKICGTFASHGTDHLCIIFLVKGQRVGSFVSEGPRTDYLSETTGAITIGVSLMEAIKMVEGEVLQNG